MQPIPTLTTAVNAVWEDTPGERDLDAGRSSCSCGNEELEKVLLRKTVTKSSAIPKPPAYRLVRQIRFRLDRL
jgi:hypothetical protein